VAYRQNATIPHAGKEAVIISELDFPPTIT
jgi:hypothetical protein